jgi:uncharacterized protein (TIGR00251 family)
MSRMLMLRKAHFFPVYRPFISFFLDRKPKEELHSANPEGSLEKAACQQALLPPFEAENGQRRTKGGIRLAREAIEITKTGLDLRIHVQPKASKTEFVGLHGDRLKVRVSAKPVEGAANKALVKFVAMTAGVAKSNIQIIRGESSREKDLRVHTDDPEAAARRIREAAGIG